MLNFTDRMGTGNFIYLTKSSISPISIIQKLLHVLGVDKLFFCFSVSLSLSLFFARTNYVLWFRQLGPAIPLTVLQTTIIPAFFHRREVRFTRTASSRGLLIYATNFQESFSVYSSSLGLTVIALPLSA